MANLRKGLTALDAVVTISGPAGVGKTTIVGRALDTITPNRMAAWVGRMQLAPDEVLQLLLTGFGINQKTTGTIRRFAVFRRLLAERAAAGAPVAIVVEDAHRIGVDALVELEALTAADTGDATSANIILMGQSNLKALLAKPELARLNQRTRLRQAVPPLSQPEANGFLKHCIRVAGGDYDKIFDAGVAEIVYSCSEGIPRMMNTLCESALTTAMEDGLTTVSAALMHKVAVDAFGYEGPIPENPADVPSEDSVAVPVVEVKAETADAIGSADDEPEIEWEAPPVPEPGASESADGEDELPPSARDIVVESGRFPELPEVSQESPLTATDELAAEPEIESDVQPDPGATAGDSAEPELPELINDTQPELSALKV
ncbi:MAG: AAA family ATPase, partial [Gammaproteobacteria bacterium]|nr:AAA family ATPase [Gammaproteobacteria bacterium]